MRFLLVLLTIALISHTAGAFVVCVTKITPDMTEEGAFVDMIPGPALLIDFSNKRVEWLGQGSVVRIEGQKIDGEYIFTDASAGSVYSENILAMTSSPLGLGITHNLKVGRQDYPTTSLTYNQGVINETDRAVWTDGKGKTMNFELCAPFKIE